MQRYITHDEHIALVYRKAVVTPLLTHSLDDVIKSKHIPCYWPFVSGIRQSPVDSPHKTRRRGALILSLTTAWTNGWANNRDAGDLIRHRAYYNVIVPLSLSHRYAPPAHLQQNMHVAYVVVFICCLVHVDITFIFQDYFLASVQQYSPTTLGLYSLKRHHLIGIGIAVINMGWSSDRLAVLMGQLDGVFMNRDPKEDNMKGFPIPMKSIPCFSVRNNLSPCMPWS